MLMVKELLHLEELKGITLLAGAERLDNEILQVNIMENPDAFDWLTPGEMLLTTGFIFKDDEAMQKRLIRDLAKMNCSALGFKLQRYFDEVPEAMIKLANKVNLPILSIPYDYNFTQIISIINQNRQFEPNIVDMLEVSTHNQMYRILEAGNGSKHVIQALAEAIQNPIILLDQQFKLSSYSDLPANPARLSELLKTAQVEQLEQTIKIFLEQQTDDQLRFYQDPINLDFQMDKETIPLCIFPIKKKNINLSYLVVWHTMHAIGPLDIIQLKVAARYLLLQLQLESSLNIESYQKRNEMFFEIIRNKENSAEDLAQFMRYYQLKAEDSYAILLLPISSKQALSNRDMMNISTHLNQLINGYKQKIICIEYRKSFILLLQNPPSEETVYLKAMNTLAKSLLQQLAINNQHTNEMAIVIGPVVSNLQQIYLSFQKALQTLEFYQANQAIDDLPNIISYDDVFLKHVVRDHLSVEGLGKIYERFIAPFNTMDKAHQTEYLRTIQAYYQNHRNITQAAKALFIHRNTLLHRLSKIEDILNISFEIAEDNLQLEFAIYIYPFL